VVHELEPKLIVQEVL